jgi:hypothetical protein
VQERTRIVALRQEYDGYSALPTGIVLKNCGVEGRKYERTSSAVASCLNANARERLVCA